MGGGSGGGDTARHPCQPRGARADHGDLHVRARFRAPPGEGAGGELTPYGGKVLTIDTQLKPLVDDNAKAVYFIRVTDNKDGVSAKTPELDLCAGEVNSQGLECFQI